MRGKKGFDELDDQPKRVSSGPIRRRMSLFGVLSALTGVVAITVTQRDTFRDRPYAEYLYQIQNYYVDPYHIAAAGAGLAALALLWRSIRGRTRAGWPVLGLLLCGVAAGTWRYQTSPKAPNSPEAWMRDHVVEPTTIWIDAKMHPVEPVPTPNKTIETSTPAPDAVLTTPPATAPAVVVPMPKPATQPTHTPSKLFPEL